MSESALFPCCLLLLPSHLELELDLDMAADLNLVRRRGNGGEVSEITEHNREMGLEASHRLEVSMNELEESLMDLMIPGLQLTLRTDGHLKSLVKSCCEVEEVEEKKNLSDFCLTLHWNLVDNTTSRRRKKFLSCKIRAHEAQIRPMLPFSFSNEFQMRAQKLNLVQG